MIKGKSIGISASCGFVLSFLTGIISSNAFVIVLLRAFIFAIVFAALAVGISLIYEKFLSSGEEVSEVKSEKAVAGNVDIVVSDENLEDDSGPQFFVENNRQKLKGNEVEEEQDSTKTENPKIIEPENPVIANPVSEKPVKQQTQETFVPVNLANVQKVSSSSAATEVVAPVKPVSPSGEESEGTSVKEVDDLPNIEDLSTDEKNDDINDIIEDSDFAASAKSSIGKSLPNSTEVSIQNADVMAGAIRTLLSKDK
ncbi:hypothetical protein [Treponema pectinovorum]|uniref:hypothetical protein n=1 Tax=Treponema pectinovorum TaxID=164 RepID=UPI003D9393FD